MKLTNKSEYALLALVYLARQDGRGLVTADEISQQQGIPRKFLEQIMLSLKTARFVKSNKGKNGGYTLACNANEITIAAVIRLFDGALAPTESVSRFYYEPTPIEKEPKVVDLMKQIRDYVADVLEKKTIADMI